MSGRWPRSTQVLGQDDAAFFAAHYDVTAARQFRRTQHSQSSQALTAQHGGRDAARADAREAADGARAKRVRPGLDDKVLADWNGLMIAALVNAGVAFDEPAWLAMAARAFMFIAAKMTHGDRLGHSWREGKLLFPGLASDHAAMIRAALALHEATGEQRLSRPRARLAGDARPPLRQPGRPAAISSPPTTPRGWWCGRTPPPTTPRPNPNALAAQNLVRLAVFTGQHAWREQADRLFEGILRERGRESVRSSCACSTRWICACAPPRSSSTGRGRAGDELLAAARKLPVPRPRRAARTVRGALPHVASGPGQDQGRRSERSLRLRRRDLLAAGDDACGRSRRRWTRCRPGILLRPGWSAARSGLRPSKGCICRPASPRAFDPQAGADLPLATCRRRIRFAC